MEAVPLEPELCDHLIVEFGAHGQRAVDYLHTARALLSQAESGDLPRQGEAVAYCLREALEGIPKAHGVAASGGEWQSASREVVEAARRYEQIRGLPGEDEAGAVDDLLRAVEGLDAVHEGGSSVHEKRLVGVMIERTGVVPLGAGTAPVREYLGLLSETNSALHNSCSLEEAASLWDRCRAILTQLFMPPDLRNEQLEALASVSEPSEDDVEQVLALFATPHHLGYFLDRVETLEWLRALSGTGLLDTPPDGGSWVVGGALERLSAHDPDGVVTFLTDAYESSRQHAARAFEVARTAVRIGQPAAAIVTEALSDHPDDANFGWLAVSMVGNLEPHHPQVYELADLMLNPTTLNATGYVDPVLDQLVSGIDEDNAGDRLQLLCWKLRQTEPDVLSRRLMRYESGGTITTWDPDSSDTFALLIRGVGRAVSHAGAWLDLDQMLEIIEELPADLSPRLRAHAVASCASVAPHQLVAEVASAIAKRDPTGDDLSLIERLVEDAPGELYEDAFDEALGDAPSVRDAAQALAAKEIPEAWQRAVRWVPLLPSSLGERWRAAGTVLGPAVGAVGSHALAKGRDSVVVGTGRSPIDVTELAALQPEQAATLVADWRPDPSDWLSGARELARTLEGTVKAAPEGWLARPLTIATELREPVYIDHYLRALGDVEIPSAVVGELIDVVELVHASPWPPTPLGDPTYDYEPDWKGAQQAAVDLLKALLSNDADIQGREDDVWAVIAGAVRDRSQPSGLVGERDPLEAAINRSSTRALETALAYIGHQYRRTETVEEDRLDLLRECLELEADDGAQARAILATRLAFLRHVAPEWFDAHADLMIGEGAPEGLAQVTVDMAVRWGRPNKWLLRNGRAEVRNAAARRVEHALDHLLVATLWEEEGYSTTSTLAFLAEEPSRMSEAGERLGRLLRHDEASNDHIRVAADIWRQAVDRGASDSLPGFGWMSEVEGLDDELWAELTRDTLAVTRGKIDRAHRVTERAAEMTPTPTTLAVLDLLIRGQNDAYERRDAIERADEVLDRAQPYRSTPEYQRLRNALNERGAL